MSRMAMDWYHTGPSNDFAYCFWRKNKILSRVWAPGKLCWKWVQIITPPNIDLSPTKTSSELRYSLSLPNTVMKTNAKQNKMLWLACRERSYLEVLYSCSSGLSEANGKGKFSLMSHSAAIPPPPTAGIPTNEHRVLMFSEHVIWLEKLTFLYGQLETTPDWRGNAPLASDSGVVIVPRTGRPSAPRFQAKLRKAQLRTVAGMILPFYLVFYFKYTVCQNTLQQRHNLHSFVQGVENN